MREAPFMYFELFSEMKVGYFRTALHSALTEMVQRPDPGSWFERRTATIRANYPGDKLVGALLNNGYDCLFAHHDRGQVGGFIGFEKREDEEPGWHNFSLRVYQPFNGTDLSRRIAGQFLMHARRSGARRARFWEENQRKQLPPKAAARMSEIFDDMAQNRLGLPFDVTAVAGGCGWIDLYPNTPSITPPAIEHHAYA